MLLWDWNSVGEAELCDYSFFLSFCSWKWEREDDSLWWANRDLMFSSHLPSCPSTDSESLTVHVWPSVSSCTCPVVYPQIYKEQLNTRVVLVAVETWTEKDHIEITTNPVQMLHEFSKYRQRIKQHADAVHLISYVPAVYVLTFIFIPLIISVKLHVSVLILNWVLSLVTSVAGR